MQEYIAQGIKDLEEIAERQNPYAIEWLPKVKSDPRGAFVAFGEMKIALLRERASKGGNFALDEVLDEMFGA